MASTLIIGAGVMGASAAWHFARRGQRDVVVIDRAPGPGGGSTSRAVGGYRAQYATSINIQLSLLSREKLFAFREDTGADPGYVTVGDLSLAESAADLDLLRESQRLQHAQGLIEAMELSLERVGWLNPALDLSGVVGAVFCPTDGYIRPLEILRGYIESATALGARFEWRTEVDGAERDAAGRIILVRTSRGSIPVDRVVNAAGPWAGALGRTFGLDVPVVPLRRQVAATVPTTALPPCMPMTTFVSDGLQLRVRDGRVLLLLPAPGTEGAPFADTVEEGWLDAVMAKARARLPVLRDVAIDRESCWAGLYDVSPDTHALLGPHPSCDNFFLMNGSSGHGVMHAPALGQLLAEIVVDGRATTIDVAPLRPGRFADGRTHPASTLG